jgi:hypothetical protein
MNAQHLWYLASTVLLLAAWHAFVFGLTQAGYQVAL